MSEVEFKKFATCDTCGVETLCREDGEDDQCGGCYWAPINHAKHQSELAALREELYQAREARDREMLAGVRLQRDLVAAEQRNAEARQLLHEWKCLYEDMRWGDATAFAKTEEFLSAKPTGSGVSE